MFIFSVLVYNKVIKIFPYPLLQGPLFTFYCYITMTCMWWLIIFPIGFPSKPTSKKGPYRSKGHLNLRITVKLLSCAQKMVNAFLRNCGLSIWRCHHYLEVWTTTIDTNTSWFSLTSPQWSANAPISSFLVVPFKSNSAIQGLSRFGSFWYGSLFVQNKLITSDRLEKPIFGFTPNNQ